MKKYTDYELLCFLTENGYKDSFKNLEVLKEGLENGSIILETKKEKPEDKEVTEAEQPEVSVVENDAKDPTEADAPTDAARVSISMPIDGSMVIDNQGKSIAVDFEGNIQAQISESHFGFINGSDRLLESFLTEDCRMPLHEYEEIKSEGKLDSIKNIANTILQSVESKIVSVDTTFADRSRGDIKQLRELPEIQDSITKIEAMLERDENSRPEYAEAINTIIKAMLNINQYSPVFKDAYRNKKALMILKYQSLLLSIVSATTYVLSSIIDYSDISIRDSVDFDTNIAPLQTLRTFNDSIENGEFKKVTTDVNVLREYYLEIPVSQMSSILEATDYISMIVGGIKNIYTAVSGSNKISNLIYKATGVIVLLLSLRDSLYSIFRMKTKVSDMLTGISAFARLGSSGNGSNIIGKLSQFANKFKIDAEYGSDMSKREVEEENRKLLSNVKQIQADAITNTQQEPVQDQAELEPAVNIQKPIVADPFGFDF